MTGGVTGVERYGSLGCRYGGLVVRFAMSRKQEKPAQVGIVSIGIDRPRFCHAAPLLRGHLNANLAGNRASYVPLQRQNIAQVFLIALRPKLTIVAGLIKVRGYPDFAASARHAADN